MDMREFIKNIKIIPEILKEYGYKSFLSGKWHIGGDPIDRGFDNTFTLLPGAFTITIIISQLKDTQIQLFLKTVKRCFGKWKIF